MYHSKYIKYKTKYNEIKKQIGGILIELEKCDSSIVDVECFMPPFIEKDEYDYLFKNRLTKETIDHLRNILQDYYPLFYNKLSNVNNKYEICIPIMLYDENDYLGIIDHKSFGNKILNYMNENKSKFESLNKNIKEFNKIPGISESDKIPKIISNLSSISLIGKKYEKILNDLIAKYNKLNNQFKILHDEYNNLVADFNKSNKDKINIKNIKKLLTYKKQELDDIIKKIEEIKPKKKEAYDNLNRIVKINKDLNNDIIANNKLLNIFDYILYDYDNDDLFNIDTIQQLIKAKYTETIKNIIEKFKNSETNAINIEIILEFFNYDNNNYNYQTEGHENSLLIYKFIKDGKDSYLAIRTEPHRHTNNYCRNSIRKAIRDILKGFDNFYYIDYIIDIKDKKGFQIDEADEIENSIANLKDYDNLPKDIQQLSPLQGNSGFCASWTIYTVMILLLNRDKSLDEIGKYFGLFGETDSNSVNYILKKHIKLYKIIILMTYFAKNYDREYYDNIIENITTNDQIYLDNLFNEFNKFDVMNKINTKLKILKNIEIKIDDEILKRDTHLCDDTIFDHKEFCLDEDISKPIPPEYENICKDSKLNKDGNILLKKIDIV